VSVVLVPEPLAESVPLELVELFSGLEPLVSASIARRASCSSAVRATGGVSDMIGSKAEYFNGSCRRF
jgi:hypothetical protein